MIRFCIATQLAFSLAITPAFAQPPAPVGEAPVPATDSDTTAPPDSPQPAKPSATPQDSPPPVVAPRPTPAVVADIPPPRPDPCRRSGRNACVGTKIGGGIVTAIGIAAAGVGIALAATPNKPIPDKPAFEKNYRSVGVMAISAGVIAIVAGAIVLWEGRRLRRDSERWKRGLTARAR